MSFRVRLSSKVCMLIVALCICHAISNCSNNAGAITKSYTTTSWSGQWEFTGFDIGSTSGDHYYLLSYSTDSECAIIREKKDGTRVWTKRYTSDACGTITIDNTETNAYFANNGNPSYAGIAKISCSDGSLLTYSTTTDFQITGNKLKLEISDSGNTIYFTGSVVGSSQNWICIWDTSTTNSNCQSTPLSFEYFSLYSNSDDWFYSILDYSSTNYVCVMRNSTSTNQFWAKTIVCSSTCPNINGFSNYDGTNIHSAFTLSASPVYSLYVIFEQSTGNVVNNLKYTNTGQDVQIGSLYIESSSITWLSFYHQSNSDYSELIKYEMATDSFITFQQTGAKYFYQYVDAANSNYWYGVVSTSKTTGALIDNIDIASLITVTKSTAVGLANSTLAIQDINVGSLTLGSSTWSTGTSNPESDFAYDVSKVCEGDSDDGLIEDEAAEAVATTVIVLTSLTVTLTAVGYVSNVSSASSSSTSTNSKQSIWAQINQYQNIILIPLLGTYLGNDFHFYITQFQFASFDFEFLKFMEFPVFESSPSIIDKLDYDQPDKLFADNEIESGSALVNHFQFIKALFIVFLLNMAYIAFRCAINKIKPKRKCWEKIVDWLAKFFYFTVYIRMLIEAILFIFVSCMLEFSQFESAKGYGLSYSIAVISLAAATLFVIPMIIHYFKYKECASIETRYFAEIYDGFKDSIASKLYTSIFIVRRFIMASMIVFLRNANIWVRCWIFMVVQASYLTYVIIVKPFEETRDNIIEIINESVFTFVVLIVTICNEESRWFKGLDQILIYSLMMVGVIISFVTFVYFIKDCIRRHREKRKNAYIENIQEEKRAPKREQYSNENSQEDHSRMAVSL